MATLLATIHAGAEAPYSLRFDVTSDDFDLSTVTSAYFVIRRERSRVEDTWAATVSDQTVTSLRMTRVFTAPDVPEPDTILLEPRLVTPAGELVCQCAKLTVRARFSACGS